MPQKHKRTDNNMTLREAVRQSFPDSHTYAFAAVEDDEVIYSFNGNHELLESLIKQLQQHIKEDIKWM